MPCTYDLPEILIINASPNVGLCGWVTCSNSSSRFGLSWAIEKTMCFLSTHLLDTQRNMLHNSTHYSFVRLLSRASEELSLLGIHNDGSTMHHACVCELQKNPLDTSVYQCAIQENISAEHATPWCTVEHTSLAWFGLHPGSALSDTAPLMDPNVASAMFEQVGARRD